MTDDHYALDALTAIWNLSPEGPAKDIAAEAIRELDKREDQWVVQNKEQG